MVFQNYLVLRYLHNNQPRKLKWFPDKTYLLNKRYVVRHVIKTEKNPNTGSSQHIYDDRYEITADGEDYLHRIEETNMTSLRSWIAIVISAIALFMSFF
ncbi:hypothetical protein PWO95_06425 [Weissella paramesenteroides]|uniref:hypothetical protein n=1 Tax=Weissella paramesenteroides TaxID=1249 RepID=UPI0023AA056B|nr:hypothetical protein [Weissella paramesenteroides]WEA52276.1 hypothetical protein PWO95_06425 [Weissella paramesenteroides]